LGNVAPVLAITGTRREAAVLGKTGVDVLALGGLSKALEQHQAPFCAIVSFGMAGALSDELHIGDWVVGSRTCGAVEADCNAEWQCALAKVLPNARIGPVYADGRLITDPVEKRTLAERHGALVADMESHFAARAAARAGVPFVVLRCISDEAGHALPPAIAVAMHSTGRLALGNILKSIVRNPSQLPEIATTLSNFNCAYTALKSAAKISGRLAFDLR
jgi:nucleoside phosphorylase